MKVLITGGSGFIGTNLVEHFLNRDCPVLNFDTEAPRNSAHLHCWRRGDLRDLGSVAETIETFGPEIILHMGARTDLNGSCVEDYSANTIGVENLILSLKAAPKLQRVIFASSRLVCRIGYQPITMQDYCPTTPYGESKVVGERIVHRLQDSIFCPWTIVRPTSIWGPWFDIPYKSFFLHVAHGRYFHPGKARILKSFGFVKNTVHQIQCLLDSVSDDTNQQTFYLADYPPVDLGLMANLIKEVSGARHIHTAPLLLLRCAAALGDAFKASGIDRVPLTSFRLQNILTPMVHDLTPLQHLAGELPFDLEDGVKITVDWLRSRGEVA